MPDMELVALLREGDPKAINEIVETYKNQLFAFIMRMVGNHAVAEDIFQDTWLRVIRHVHKFRGDAKISTWLFQIALNLCRDAERKRKRHVHIPIEDADYLTCEPGVDAFRIIEAQQVREMVDTIPEKMREVVVLRYFHDLHDDEIAEIVGCPVGTVKTRFYRASKILRKKWAHLNKETEGNKAYETV